MTQGWEVASPSAADDLPGGLAEPGTSAAVGPRALRTLATVGSGAVAAVSGVAPHVLHHVGPLAGAALLAGAGGTLLFGLLGFALSIPMLLRLRRRFGTWVAPAVASAVFSAVYLFSALVIGPAITAEPPGQGGPIATPSPTDHASHH